MIYNQNLACQPKSLYAGRQGKANRPLLYPGLRLGPSDMIIGLTYKREPGEDLFLFAGMALAAPLLIHLRRFAAQSREPSPGWLICLSA